MSAFRSTALAAVAFAAAAALPDVAVAQGKKCEMNLGSPFQINSAKLYLNRAMNLQGKPDEKPAHLRSTVNVLSKAEKIDNQLARQYMLGKALLWYTEVPGQPIPRTRGEAGFETNPNAPIDLLASADSAFTYVETTAPQCKDSTTLYRKQPWVRLVNRANEAANANQLDSAEILARRSLLIYRSPFGYNTLALVAQNRNQTDSAVHYFNLTVASAQGDTSATVVKMRRDAMYAVAVLRTNAVATVPEAQRPAEYAKVATLWRAVIADNPDNVNAKSALASALAATGDTQAIAGLYAEMLANPAKYQDWQLFEAGVGAARAKQPADAIKLFEAGLAQNPYFRDGLFNVATTYAQLKDGDRTIAAARRLIAVDPSNPNNYRLLARGHQLRLEGLTDAKAKKVVQDSLLAALQLSQSMPVRVSFTQFDHVGAKHTLTGMVENLGTAAGSYELKMEFLDKAGAVVASQTATVGPVAPKTGKPFTIEVSQAGVVAYRYAALK